MQDGYLTLMIQYGIMSIAVMGIFFQIYKSLSGASVKSTDRWAIAYTAFFLYGLISSVIYATVYLDFL